MGTLRCYEWIENEDGSLTSAIQSHEYNEVLLGEPIEIDGDPNSAEYDHQLFPNGVAELVDDEVIVTPDESPAP